MLYTLFSNETYRTSSKILGAAFVSLPSHEHAGEISTNNLQIFSSGVCSEDYPPSAWRCPVP